MQALGLKKVNELYEHCKARQKKMSYYQDGVSIALRLDRPNCRQAFSMLSAWASFLQSIYFRKHVIVNSSSAPFVIELKKKKPTANFTTQNFIQAVTGILPVKCNHQGKQTLISHSLRETRSLTSVGVLLQVI